MQARRSGGASGKTATSRRGPDPRDVAVGARVRAFRIKAGLSQDEVAKQLGVRFQQVQKYETGVNRIPQDRLETMAKMFKVPVEAFSENHSRNGIVADITLVKNRSRAAILLKLEAIGCPKVESMVIAVLDTIIAREKRQSP